jgi:hypothetical protein
MWWRDTRYDKTLISKIPLKWSHGFHTALDTQNNLTNKQDDKLFMLHLHRFDFNIKIKRNIERLQNIQDYADYGGGQNKIVDIEWIKQFFKSNDHEKTAILEEHKNFLLNYF